MMRKIIPVLLTLMLLAGCSTPSNEATDYQQISTEVAVTTMAEEENDIILDVRTEAEYAERHIPNAINIPNESIGSEELPDLPDKDQLILVYCSSGNRSRQAAEKLAALGYTNIVDFGGINNWPGETVSE